MYEAVVINDIGAAADIFPSGVRLAERQRWICQPGSFARCWPTTRRATIKEAKALWARLNRPNVMIKVPATPAGLPAIEELIASWVECERHAHLCGRSLRARWPRRISAGLERRAATGQPIDRIASVASFFVSRIDTAVDKQLEKLSAETNDPARKQKIESLMGKAAIANAKLAYESFQKIFSATAGTSSSRRARRFSGRCGLLPARRIPSIATRYTLKS